MPEPQTNRFLQTEIKFLKGVGPVRAEALAARGILTITDLLDYMPFRYEDRQHIAPVRELVPGQTATILVNVLSCGLSRTRRGIFIYDLAASDITTRGMGGLIRCKWFNAVYLDRKKVFQPGQQVFFYGKVERDPFGTGNLQMIQPQYEILSQEAPGDRESLEMGRTVPIYESIGRLTPRVLRHLVWNALAKASEEIAETLPPSIFHKHDFPSRAEALRQVHFPDEDQPLATLAEFRTPAQVRLIFEEFFRVAAGLALRRREASWAAGFAMQANEKVRAAIKRILPFHPTAAQKRVLKEIAEDMRRPHPMSRLLQGDVGSGKTIVAIQAAILAIENGYQTAIMAPTEILATQHFLSCKQILASLGYEVELLVSARKSKEKEEVKQKIAQGKAQLVVGTHALIQEDVQFAKLGLAVVDEQHRFGVLQRYELIRKGPAPHVLVMTATPIPRSLALTCYGDLDLSVIDELPPNRTPITTTVLEEDERERAYEVIREKVSGGEQAYAVYPLIEESEKLDLRPAMRMYEQLSRNVFPDLRVGLLHGRLPAVEKESVMQRFKSGEIQVLVSTTVIEVGVDVPNATVMLVEHAERFGLAQLHQLRGRIGRGAGKSYCLLLARQPRTEEAEERLQSLASTTDGFRIAEMDFKIRGPGEFFGTRQWGIPAFHIANLLRDQEIMEWARREAFEFVERSEGSEEFKTFTQNLRSEWSSRYGLVRVG
ncbi:MAG TPA: ATP-dependent DNA helicase RecG [Terriglobia bacterium]|nr:ATP-dependent DNA helicase RecG [Terriglobia bacterium]